jgi:hypothetical protein
MKLIPLIASIALCSLFSSILQATAKLEFLFTDGTSIEDTTNTGDSSGTWAGSPLTTNVDGNGTLNIGYNNDYQTVGIQANNTVNTLTLDSPISSGKQTFEVVISAHDISAAWASPSGLFVDTGKSIQFELIDGIGLGAKVGIRGAWNLAEQVTDLYVFSDDTYGNVAINNIEYTRTDATAPAAVSSLLMGVSDITLQIEVDFDNGGSWTSRAKWGSGDWVALTQNGIGLSDITLINMKTSYASPTYSWGSSGVGDFVEISGFSMTEFVAQSTADIEITGSAWGANNDTSLSATAVSSKTGDSDQTNSEDVTIQVAADLSSGDWVSRYKLGTGDWVALVTDGLGMTNFNRIQLNTKTSSSESWGDSSIQAPSTGDYIKVDSVRILSGSNFDKGSASVDVDYNTPLLALEFNDAAGTDLLANATSGAGAVAALGSVTGAFNYTGHLTDGNGALNIGYAGDNSWTNNFQGSFRTFTFDSPVTSSDAAIAVFEVVIPEYNLSKAWDTNNTIGSFDGKGLQVSIQNSSNAGASVNLFSDNAIIPNSILQLDFDDPAGTNLPDTSVFSSVDYTGSWEFGGPQTDGDGNLNIGYAGNNKWSGIYSSTNVGSVWRSFIIDSDQTVAGNQAIESGRYIFETKVSAADLSGSWKDASHLVANKGMQIILRKSDNSGAVLNFYSHNGNNGYQIKAQSNTWAGAGTTGGTGLTQAYGLSSSGDIDLQIRVNADTGQWTTHAKSSSSDTWKDMELSGTGLTNIASIQIGVKTPILDDAGTSEDTSDDTLYDWGDDTLSGNAPEAYVDANGDGQFNAGTNGSLTDTPSNGNSFVATGFAPWPWQHMAVTPVESELPADSSISISADATNSSVTWEGTEVTLEESSDLENWADSGATSSPHVEGLGSEKFYRLTASVPAGASSALEQIFVIDVDSIDGSANYSVTTSLADGSFNDGPSTSLIEGTNTITVPAVDFERHVRLRINGTFTFTSFSRNGESIFVAGESYTDTNGNGQRDSGNAGLLGDYIKIDHIRITEDQGPDANNSVVASSKLAGSITGTAIEDVQLENSSSLNGSIQLKVIADLSTGAWSSAFSSDDGGTWTDLVTDGAGLTSIANFTFGSKTHQYDAWGDDTIAGGSAGDYVTIDSIVITDTNSGSNLLEFEFNEVTGTWMKQQPGSTYGEAVNAGSVTGAWNFGGPRIQQYDAATPDGSLNIGYTKNWKWTAPNAFRKYIFDAPITSANATSVEMIVSIDDYSLARAWDNSAQYNINSLSGKGMLFRLDSSTSDYATVEFATSNAADDAFISQDADGDGQPDWVDPYPDDSTNGQAVTGIYVNQLFNDVSPSNNLSATDDTGTHGTNWNYGGPTAQDGNLVIGFPGSNGWSGMIGGTQGWRKKILTSDLTSGVVVLETVISEYDLSKSWDTSNSSAEKGWRIVLTNGNTSGNQQGPIIALYTTESGGTEVYGSAFYGGERIVFSEGDVRVDLANSSQASAFGENLTFQIVCDLDSGLWYSRYKVGGGSWSAVNQYGAGFYNIDNIRISHKNAAGDNWGVDSNVAGDFVLIDSIKLADLDQIDSSIPLPSTVVPSTYANLDAVDLHAYDVDEDGRLDAHEEYPNDGDNDGSPAGTDADDSDPDVQ